VTDYLHDAAGIIAKAVKKTSDPHSGWSKYVPAGDTAIRVLVESGWTPPGDQGDSELDRLHKALAAQQDEVAAAWTHTYRIEAERDAAGAFRVRFLDLLWELQKRLTATSEAARRDGEPEPTYTGEQVLQWLTRNLDLADVAAKRTKAKEMKKSKDTPTLLVT
jgi:hypothetical protein